MGLHFNSEPWTLFTSCKYSLQQCSHLMLYKWIKAASRVVLWGDLICAQQPLGSDLQYTGSPPIILRGTEGNNVKWTVDYFENADTVLFPVIAKGKYGFDERQIKTTNKSMYFRAWNMVCVSVRCVQTSVLRHTKKTHDRLKVTLTPKAPETLKAGWHWCTWVDI